MRNIEIKGTVRDMKSLLETARQFSASQGEIIPQKDTFYIVQEGRLKLREFKDGNAELIFYKRPNSEGPKLSQYSKADVVAQNVSGLQNVLTKALGVGNTVKKTRKLFLIGQTRIHIDEVEGLGEFVELEVVLKPEQTLEEGKAIANSLMELLGIERDDLLKGSYTDMLSR